MWGLYGWLLAKGQLAFVNTKVDAPSVGIYPEIYENNDMEANTVVRYILQKPGMMGTSDENGVFKQGPTEFPKEDKIYVFSKIYDTFGVKDDHILFLPILNMQLFKDYGKKRTKTAYLVGKGINTHKHPEDSVEITRQFAIDQKALADLLNECQTLYCYDPVSAMMEVSRLCGCPVAYHGGKTRDELKDYEPGLDGIDFGEGTMWSSENFRDHYKQLVTDFSLKLDRFIEETQS